MRVITICVLVIVLATVLARANTVVYRRGIIYDHGVRRPPIICLNNDKYNASIYYRGRMYVCQSFSTTEILN